jgi:hypothetical protein
MAGAAAAAPAVAAPTVAARTTAERRPVRALIRMENKLGRRAVARTSAESAAKSATGSGSMRVPSCWPTPR